MPPLLCRIGQVSVRARDLERAVAFYRDTLGMRHLFTTNDQMAFFDCDDTRLLLTTLGPEGAQSSIVYFQVEDIEGTSEALQKRGVVFQAAPHVVARMPDCEVWMAFFADSEGNTVGLMSEVPRGGE